MQGFVLRNGRVIDPSQDLDFVTDVFVTADGRISGIGKPELPLQGQYPDEWSSIDVSGCIVTPGLIDCHVHAYEHATPLGINIDDTCLSRGVTAVVDAGSAGSSTLPGLLNFVGERSVTRLYCFVHIARHGLADAGCVSPTGGGECDSLNVVDCEACTKTIESKRDTVVGVKIRLARTVADNGNNEKEAFRRALKASGDSSVPLMVHHALSSIHLGGTEGPCCPGDLRPGDIYTHCFHGQMPNIVDSETKRVNPYVWDAKRRGVLFDVGHGQGSFSWRVAEQCAAEGFWPDMISTDLHTGSLAGPAYDLPAVMSKMLYLGMPLKQVIAAVTVNPAKAIGKSHELGQLASGRQADVTVLRLEDVCQDLEDAEGEMRTLTKAFQPCRVFRSGKEYRVMEGTTWPNPESVKACRLRTAVFQEAEKNANGQ